ncbi:sensor histidine kinase [Chengkuizengella axinellae]|uniref:histidine kinase n=1 Tax=Chengkuizengella axinellae TaxID=3064388 RepID=A0ABT9J5B7_9BACL|nr:ATP-binding protein [Chengkuizengella sp. 2205SS18-9]MDP5276803.1 hypothetical protein [Chengkuizengella sp. 2205SS18-9]
MRKKLLFMFLICAVAMSLGWFIYITLSYPFTGIVLEKNDDDEWVIEEFDSVGVDVGLKLNDIILEIDNLNPNEFFTVQKFHSLEQFNQVLVLRNNERIEINKQHSPVLSIFEIFILLSSLLCLLFIYILFNKTTPSKSIKYLMMVHFVFFIIFITAGASSRSDIFATIIILIVVPLSPIVFLNFLYEFLREKGGITFTTKFFKYIYFFLIAVLIFPQLIYFLDHPRIYDFFAIFRTIVVILFLLGIILNIAFVTYIHLKYRKLKLYTSTIIRSVLFSLLLSFAPICILTIIPELLIETYLLDIKYSIWFMLFFPFSFTYLIISKQIYDLNVITRRVLFITIFSLLPSIFIISLIIYIFIPEVSLMQLPAAVLILSLILFVTLFSTRYIINKFEKWIYPKRHSLKTNLNHIIEKLGAITNFHEFKSIILPEIIKLYKVHGAAIILIYKNNYESISEGTIDIKEVKNLLKFPKNLEEHPFYTSYLINQHNKYSSYLVLTKKINNTMLGLEEKQWLLLISSYLKICLENIYYLRKLRFELQEKERFRIATDLHDSTMQDLFFLKRRLGKVVENESINLEEIKEMDNILDYIDIINLNLRQGCFELYPYTIQDMGLKQAIHKLIEQLQSTHDLEISFISVNEVENYSVRQKRQLFRIIQELLDNTIKHACASSVNISFNIKNNILQLTYEDDGVGFNTKIISEGLYKPTDSGLDQVRYRVLDLNGKFKIISSTQSGVQIKMMFPIG